MSGIEITHGVVSSRPDPPKAPVEKATPTPKPAAKPRSKARAKPTAAAKEKAALKRQGDDLVALQGGPLDGRITTIGSHDDLVMYVRTDAQHGDARIYRFATADGEALATSVSPGPDQENRLHADLAQEHEIYEPGSGFEAPKKAHAKESAKK